jgi:hypothetical protein
MTPDQVELMKTAARTLLAHRDAGRKCDPHAVKWAEQLLTQNTQPQKPESEEREES